MNDAAAHVPTATTLERTPAQRELVARETRNGVVGNALIALVIVWLLFRGQSSIPLLGREGGAFGFVPGTFMFTLGMSIGLTLAVRAKVRRKVVPRLSLAESGPARRLPDNVVLRALVLAVLAFVAFVPATYGLLAVFAPAAISLPATLALNVVYFVALSAVVVPIVAWRALADPA